MNQGKQISRRTLYGIILTYCFSALLLLLVWAMATSQKLPLEYFFADPAKTLKTHPFVGLMSNIGVLLWCASAAMCFLSSAVLQKHKQSRKAKFMLFSGLLTTALLLDDFFMVHDYLLYSTNIVLPFQFILFTIYGIFIIAYLTLFYRYFYSKLTIVLVVGIIFFGLSMIIDLMVVNQSQTIAVLEDVFKFLGIVNWSLFLVITAYKLILQTTQNK